MPITAYPQYSYWKTADSSETVMAGGFSFQDSQQLRQAVVHLYKHGNGGGSERIRPKLFHDRQLTKLYATGAWDSLLNLGSNQGGLTTSGLRPRTTPGQGRPSIFRICWIFRIRLTTTPQGKPSRSSSTDTGLLMVSYDLRNRDREEKNKARDSGSHHSRTLRR